jgi:hypothetical protein
MRESKVPPNAFRGRGTKRQHDFASIFTRGRKVIRYRCIITRVSDAST